MDGDIAPEPVVEPELDAFSLFLPLPFRVALIIVLGVWAWGANLQYLQLLRIDVPVLIRYPTRTSSSQPPHYKSAYRLASLLTTPLVALLLLFWLFTFGDAKAVQSWEILPNLYLLILVICFFLPFHIFSGSGRWRTLTTLKRISVGGIAEAQDGKFGDILMADALTSYAKVLGDLFVALCLFFSKGKSSTALPDRTCGGQFMVPLIISVPSLIRLRQCLTEYGRVQKALKDGMPISKGWGGQHLANALKYSTAFPVIILSAMQRGHDWSVIGMSEAGLFRLWMIAVFVNSFYSFYWDVTKDWDLTLFLSAKERNDPEHPWGLRRRRYFSDNNVYYGVILLDFVLRCTWSFKLSPHLDHFNDLEQGIFCMELLEVFRRWVWIFFRVEAEWLRNNSGPAVDDVLLGDIGSSKFDDD